MQTTSKGSDQTTRMRMFVHTCTTLLKSSYISDLQFPYARWPSSRLDY